MRIIVSFSILLSLVDVPLRTSGQLASVFVVRFNVLCFQYRYRYIVIIMYIFAGSDVINDDFMVKTKPDVAEKAEHYDQHRCKKNVFLRFYSFHVFFTFFNVF